MMIRIRTILLTIVCVFSPVVLVVPPVMADATADSQASEKDYVACCGVMKSIIDGYDHNDAAAVTALYYCKPGTDPKTVDAMGLILEWAVADYRLTSAATSRFGVHGAMIQTGLETDPATFLGVLSRISPQNARASGNTLTILPPSTTNSEGWPIYFVNAQDGWKLDWTRTVRVTIRANRRKPIAGETSRQTIAAAIHLLVNEFDAIADDIDKGNISDEAEAQRRVSAAWGDLDSQFRDFGVHSAKPH
jgi:hypothetical protein